jgi:hypothetical protein
VILSKVIVHSLHSVHEMNAYRAGHSRACLSALAIMQHTGLVCMGFARSNPQV